MDNQENNRNNWVDDILGAAPAPEEIGPDEHAVYTAGLTHPDDLELEKILAEDWSGGTEEETPAPPQEAFPEAYVPQEITDSFNEAAYVPTEVPQEQPVQEEAPVKRQRRSPATPDPTAYIRPQKKKAYAFFGVPHLISTVIWILLIVVVGISLGRTLWVCCAEVMAFGKDNHQVTITVSKDDTLDQVAEKLGNAKLIDYPQLFKTFATATGKSENIAPGTYTLNAKLDYNAMINAMSNRGTREIVEIMFTEGYTCAQIFKLLEDNGVCTVADMENFLETYDPEQGDLDEYWFLEDLEWGDKYALEGYLAPDTYEFYVNDDPERVLTKFLDEFDDRFTDIMKEDFETLQYNHMEALYEEGYSSQYIQEHKLTVHDVLTLASIVQRETGSSSESFDIASVFYNRLASGMELGSDATVYYAIGDYFSENGELTASDLQSNSPYNTRKFTGLPPGPICNPGTYALYAALDPNETDYKYFVYDSGAKEHLFSTTLEEHERKCRELGLW